MPTADLLPDLLFPSPRLVFIGTAAGTHSARTGAYYAHPSNKFWPTLHAIGLTPRCFSPHEFAELQALGIGLTDVCKTESGMDHQIKSFDIGGLKARLDAVQPQALAFTSKKAASLYLAQPTQKLAYGQQSAAPNLHILPSPSGAAGAAWNIAPWRALAHWFHVAAPGARP